MIKKIIFAALNVDATILQDLDSNKEQNLIYTSFVRLFLSTLVVFGVTLFACHNVPDLAKPYGGLYAWLVATLVAMIVFWLDSAIIGSEWEKPQTPQSGILKARTASPIVDELTNFIFKVVRLLPRIAFSVIVAFFIATIAELALQKTAIREVLTDRAIEHNDKHGNTERRETKIKTHDSRIKTLTDLLQSIEAGIKAHDTSNLETRKIEQDTLINKKSEIEIRLDWLKKIKSSKNLAATEIIPNTSKCRSSDPEKCKGVNYENSLNVQRNAENALREMGYAVDPENVDSQIQEQQDELDDVTIKIANIDEELAKVGNRTRPELVKDLAEIEVKIKNEEQKNADDLRDFDKDEAKQGNFRDPDNFDFLLLYLGLQTLYDDPDKGDAAEFFSFWLFIFIVLMELSSVIAALFFAPYSIYASKVYTKIKKRQLEEAAEIHKFERKLQMDILSKSDWERTMDNAMNQDRRSDNPNPTPPPQKE